MSESLIQLFIDTATERSIIGLAEKDELIEEVLLPAGNQSSKALFPALLALLAKHELSPKDLKFIGCGVGPGSYTGMRIGAATAKGLTYALQIPLIGISSLEGFIPNKEGEYIVLVDAKVSGAYMQKGFWDGKISTPLTQPSVLPLAELPAQLPKKPHLISPQGGGFQEKVQKFVPDAEWQTTPPNGKMIAKKIFTLFQQKQFSEKGELNLLYLRKTEAELMISPEG